MEVIVWKEILGYGTGSIISRYCWARRIRTENQNP